MDTERQTAGGSATHLIAGATGNVGGELVRLLATQGSSVRALVRESGRRAVPGVEAVVGDLNDPVSLRPALQGVRSVFLLAGYADMPGLLAEIRAAGAEHVVLLSSGAVEGGERENAITRYHMESEEAVRASGLTWTMLRPSGFMSGTLGWAEPVRRGDPVREPFADVPIAVIDPADIAAVAAAALEGGRHVGQVHRLTGPQALTPVDRARVLGRVLGREIRLEPIPDQQAHRELRARMPEPYADAFFRYFAEGTYDDSIVHTTVEEVTGRSARTFEDWARAHAESFVNAEGR